MDIELRMPDLATTDSSMRVVRWLIEVGQTVRRGDPILEVETDKATMELEAIASGRLKKAYVHAEDEVTVGQLIATLETQDSPGAAAPVPSRATETKQEGKGGMFAKNRASAALRDTADMRATVALSSSQRTVARRLQESKQTIPHFYLQTSANAERLVALRQAAAPTSIAWDAFFVHATAKALGKFERIGFRYESDRLTPVEVDAIGVAVDHEGELFVVSVPAPAGKTPEALSSELMAAVHRIRSGDDEARRLRPARLTITNLGSTGVESFTAIVNPPEAAILAVGKVAQVAVVSDGAVVPQHRVSLTLSVDHRVVNGKYAAEFLQAVVHELEAL